MVIFFKAEDVVNLTTKYIPAVMFDRRNDVNSVTYSIGIYLYRGSKEQTWKTTMGL